ncbi:MAG TPA: hypothetical protein VK527_09595 [Candidatus Limnocylindrales bacterium]|nr:hypothetical protein [Candidatus Limnocylindrales bacterium]
MNPAYEALLRELNRARRMLIWRSIERAGFGATFGLLALGGLALLAALLLPLHRSEYMTLKLALLLGACGALIFALVRVLRSRTGLPEAALEASRLIHERDDGLLTAFELGRAPGSGPSGDLKTGYSDALTQHAVRAAADRASLLPLGRLRVWKGRSGSAKRLAIVVAILAGVAAVGGSRTVTSVSRIADPERAPLAPIKIRVEPGSEEVEGGASVPDRVYVSGTTRKPRLLSKERSSEGERSWRETSLEPAADAHPRARERAYATVIANLKEDLSYQVRAADQVTPIYRISVRDLPRASGFRVHYEYPAYCRLTSETANAITGDLAAPRGTRARVEILLNRSVGQAWLQYEGGAAPLTGEVGERLVRFTVPVRADAKYRVRLVDARGRKVDLGPYDIKAIPDRPPTVTIVSPGPVEDVTRDLSATILAGATDDYGVKRILLRYQVREEAKQIESLHEEKDGSRELAIRYTWSLGSLNLLPGEEIQYEVGAVDGNQVDGPQTTWSDIRTLRFPSAAEILSSVERQQDESVATLEDAIRSAQALKEKSEELARDLGRTKELPWEKAQDIQKSLEGQQALRDQIDKVAEKLGQDADKLAQSRALNAELVQKLNELHTLLNQLKDQSILRAIQRVQEALKKMSPQDLERAMQQMKLTQEDVVRNLERTIDLLKQLKMEEKLEAAAERASDMARRQLALNDSLARARQPNDVKDLAKGEKEIQKMSREQRAALDSLAAELKAMDRQTAGEAEDQRDKLAGMYPLFEKSVESMEQSEKQEAKESTQDLEHQLEAMRNAMNKMKEDFVFRKKNDVGRKMDAAIADLLEIADAQENLLDDQKSAGAERAPTQQGLEETTEGAANRIGELGRKSLFITPDVMQAVGRALANQRNAVGRYSMEDVIGGLMLSKEATIALNQAASALLKGRDAMNSAKSSTGFQEAMQMLQSLSGDQQKLNGKSLSLMPGSQGQNGQEGRLSPSQSGALSRMAAEQEAIRRGLQEAMQKLGQGGGTLGQLGETGEDMKKVVQDLRGGRLDQTTLDRQQRILSRLLDAPRSVEKRDYSRRRTSRPGVDVVRSSPGALSPELLKSRPSLAALLARGGRDPVSPRYRALVDQYFQAILSGKMR